MSDEIQVEGEELPHLLLVDDDATFTRVMARAMSRRGFRVSTAGSAEEGFTIAQAETFALGGKKRFADLLGDGQRHTGAVVTNADGDVFRVPVQLHAQAFRAGVGGIVQQVEQGLGEIRRRRHARHTALAQQAETVTGFGAHQVPAIQGFVEPLGHVLHFHRQAAIGFGGAHQLLQSLLALLDLLAQYAEVFLQRRIGVVLNHFVKQHAHGGQRRTQLVGGSGGLGGNGQQLLVAQAFLRRMARSSSWRRSSSAMRAAKKVMTAADRAKLSHIP